MIIFKVLRRDLVKNTTEEYKVFATHSEAEVSVRDLNRAVASCGASCEVLFVLQREIFSQNCIPETL